MNKDVSLEKIMAKLEKIEQLLTANPQPSIQPDSIPSSFLPGGKDWFLLSSEEERRAFNRKRGQTSRCRKK
jgi:hypothetical protein